MSKIRLALGVPEHILLTIEVAEYYYINSLNGALEVTTPMGDDWYQSRAFDLVKLNVSITEDADHTKILVFKNRSTLGNFLTWLVEAIEAAQEGYRTMRG